MLILSKCHICKKLVEPIIEMDDFNINVKCPKCNQYIKFIKPKIIKKEK